MSETRFAQREKFRIWKFELAHLFVSHGAHRQTSYALNLSLSRVGRWGFAVRLFDLKLEGPSWYLFWCRLQHRDYMSTTFRPNIWKGSAFRVTFCDFSERDFAIETFNLIQIEVSLYKIWHDNFQLPFIRPLDDVPPGKVMTAMTCLLVAISNLCRGLMILAADFEI